MHRSIVAISGFALTLFLLAPVLAQEQERGPGQRGPRGGIGGGFFGGMGGLGSGGGSILILLREPAVQEEIEVVDDQRQQLRQLGDTLRPQFDRDNFRRDMSEEERRAALAEMRVEMEKAAQEAQTKVAEILLPHQMERLQQISLQVRGAQALADPQVAAKLNLTDQQKQQIETAQSAMRDKWREVYQSGNPENMREQMETARREFDQQIVAFLTPEQKTQWEEMKGEAFAMPEGAFGRGRGGFRGGEGRRGQGDRGQRGAQGQQGEPDAQP